jgi:hypothetical protein
MVVNVGESVHLDGAGLDVDGDRLTYSWSFVSMPAGSSAVLQGATSASASFTPDVGGQYRLSLTVSDGEDSHSDECTVSANSPPVANVGPDQSVTVGDAVLLDGTGSSDPDGDNLSYTWSVVSRPAGSAAALQNSTSARPTLTPDLGGDYVVRLVVSDGTLPSNPADCTVSANTPPVANAGQDQEATVGDLVQLDGGASHDPDGSSSRVGIEASSSTDLTYLWSFVTRPEGSSASLSSTTSVNPNFTADVEGTFVVSLVVDDGIVLSAPDEVTITVTEPFSSIFLRSSIGEPSKVLSNQPATSGSTTITLLSEGASIDFEGILGGALSGARFGFSIWLAAGISSGQTGTWRATILIVRDGVETTLASHAFTVPFDTHFLEYATRVTGIPGGTAGDKVILRLTLNDASQGAVLFGAAPLDSHIQLPGEVTVSPAAHPPGFSADEEVGVKVEVSAGLSRRYSGG